MEIDQNERFYAEPSTKQGDYRKPADRDHDRILYSSAFRRLANVTQVTHVQSGSTLHNRLTHSLKVGRVARGLAEKLNAESPQLAKEVAGPAGIDAAAAECAGLAHDIGHPPFGHLAEEVLNELITESGDLEGFEGNAQTFRVVTKLSIRKEGQEGLNLTRRTLNALLKYPWRRGTSGKEKRKWGAYSSEEQVFSWVRKGSPEKARSIEAELMDFADDITYSTHDVDDYYRAGLIPLDRLLTDSREVERFLSRTFSRWKKTGDNVDEKKSTEVFENLLKAVRDYFPDELTSPFDGGGRQRAAIHSLVSTWINRFLNGISLKAGTPGQVVQIDGLIKEEISLLKQLIWNYVIENPLLTDKEYGQKKVIRSLFEILRDAVKEKDLKLFSNRYREQIEVHGDGLTEKNSKEVHRILADIIAEMTEAHAYDLYRRFNGFSAASILDFARK